MTATMTITDTPTAAPIAVEPEYVIEVFYL